MSAQIVGIFVSGEDADELILIEEWDTPQSHQRFFEELASSGLIDGAVQMLAAQPGALYYEQIAD